ncbi:MAG: hypothetical protein SXA11_20925 [Cyanobacteriota bacterium]|nr:hypothetical protein [Cyanobacteriota bacterium]
MTRFIHDQFSKDYLETLLEPYGEVTTPKKVAAEVKEIDLWFTPKPELKDDLKQLGLLGRMAETTAIFEPFRNAATGEEIFDCAIKLRECCREIERNTKGGKKKANRSQWPYLWVLTPTASEATLSGVRANLVEDWLPGIYFLGETFRSAVVALHQLPEIPDTLWLRMLGKGRKQQRAIDELEALPKGSPYRQAVLSLLLSFKKHLAVTQGLDAEDRSLIMRLEPLFDREIEQIKQEYEERIQGERRVLEERIQQERRKYRQSIEGMLRLRFGEIDEELATIIEPLAALPSEEYMALMLQLPDLSRDELLARFRR